MMRCGENNHHVHGSYEKEMAPSSDVNDTDEDELKKPIVHEPFDEPSSENLFMDVSEKNAISSMKLYHSPIHNTYQIILLRN